MRKLLYSPEYKEKLIRLRNDLDMEYGQLTRKKIFAEIDKHVQHLKDYPFLGVSVRAMFGINCDYYYIHVAKNVIFYDVVDQGIEILNIYNEREDYMITFLGSKTRLCEE